jgi:hypothetical protein
VDAPDGGRLRLNALRRGIESCFTFASIAQINYELGKDDDAERFLAYEEREYCSLLCRLSQSRDLPSGAKRELQSEIIEVRERLNEVKQLSRISI